MHANLQRIDSASLKNLASALRDGVLATGVSTHAVKQFAGACGADVAADLTKLRDAGWTTGQIATLVDAIADAKESRREAVDLFDLVLSGPDVAGVPTADTAAVVRSMIEGACGEIMLVGYAVHNGRRLFEPLVQRMRAVPALRVRFCLDIARKLTDTSLASEIIRRFAREFREKHWPWPELPEVFYDPRALAASTGERASLHAKCVIVDRKLALITSANFTQAAQEKNVEVGVLARDSGLVGRLAGYFDGLLATAMLQRCPLE